MPGSEDPTPLRALDLLEVSLTCLPRWLWTPVLRVETLRPVKVRRVQTLFSLR